MTQQLKIDTSRSKKSFTRNVIGNTVIATIQSSIFGAVFGFGVSLGGETHHTSVAVGFACAIGTEIGLTIAALNHYLELRRIRKRFLEAMANNEPPQVLR
jgi:hypothetical protein